MNSQSLVERIGERLQRARAMRGYSLRELAEKLMGKVSHTQLANYESAKANPDSDVLVLLARALEVSVDYFVKLDLIKLADVEYRKLTKLGVKSQHQLEEQALDFFERYLEMEQILGLEKLSLNPVDLAHHSKETLHDAIEQAAEDLRHRWELGLQPILNIHCMLEEHGIKVKLLEVTQDGFDGFSAFAHSATHRVPVIGLNKAFMKDKPRLRFTAAHELGHLLLLLPAELTVKEKETACHRFASSFLIPREPFMKAFGNQRSQIAWAELYAMKSRWGMSVAAIMKRAHQLGLISDSRYKSFCFVYRKNKSTERDVWQGSEESARFKQLVYRGLSEGLISQSKAGVLLGVTQSQLAADFDILSVDDE